MRKFIIILATYCLGFGSGNAQQVDNHYSNNDSIMIITAQKYLNDRLGAKFVKKSVEINSVDSIQGLITFLIRQHDTKSKRNMIVVFVDGEKIDSLSTPKIKRADIEKYYNGTISTNIFLNKTYAIELAEKIGFQKGIHKWSVKLLRSLDAVTWEITNTQKEQLNKPYFTSGKGLSINAKSGKYRKFNWVACE
ncbi:MAG: hypothetical protein PHT07_21250 [Paludibacter sp.]|nr:hypothetical protein [Paludibacter sp.]